MKRESGESSPTKAAGGAVEVAVEGIHQLVKSLTLMPGQPVRQEHVAAALSLSRAPIREAMRILHSEGILDYEANVGYSVRRLSSAEFEQMYVMRKALEDIVLSTLPRFTKVEIRQLRGLNNQLRVAGSSGDIPRMRDLNEQWHFRIFNKSPHHLIVREIERIWAVTHSYRSFYLYEADSRERVVCEHEQILDALEEGNNREAILTMDRHRGGVPAKIEQIYAQMPLFSVNQQSPPRNGR